MAERMVRYTFFNDRGVSRSLLLFCTGVAFIASSTATIESRTQPETHVLVLHSYTTWCLLLNSILLHLPNIPLNKHMLEYHPSNIHRPTSIYQHFDVFSTLIHSTELFHQPTLMHSFLYSLTIRLLHYYPRHVSSINMPIFRRKKTAKLQS